MKAGPARPHEWGVLAAVAAVLVALALAPPLAEPAIFKGYVDGRRLFGIPNFWNVVSNAPLSLVGAWGLALLARGTITFIDPVEKRAWWACFAAVALSGVGSAYYHLAPDPDRLMWDRLPIALAFMALVSVIVSERLDTRAGARLLGPLLAAGAASVLYWRWSLAAGAENILPYVVVQYGALGAILALSLLARSRYSRGGDFVVAFGLYALAKLAEVLDAPIYEVGYVLSGHSIKHLLAAVSIGWLAWMLQRRRPVPQPRPG